MIKIIKGFSDWYKEWSDYEGFKKTTSSEKTSIFIFGFFTSLIIYSIIFFFLLDSYKNGILVGLLFSVILNLSIKKHSFHFANIAMMLFGAFMFIQGVAIICIIGYYGYKLLAWLWNKLPY
jgi:hypothetical protein